MTETVVKNIDMNKNSLTMTYRQKKGSESLEITGFDLKCYGDSAEQIEKALKELEAVAKKMMGPQSLTTVEEVK